MRAWLRVDSCSFRTCDACEPSFWCFAATTLQVGAALEDFISDALRVTSLDIQGENSRPNLHWLYLIMEKVTLLKELCGELEFSP